MALLFVLPASVDTFYNSIELTCVRLIGGKRRTMPWHDVTVVAQPLCDSFSFVGLLVVY